MRIIDWSSGVCSSDLQPGAQAAVAQIAADRGRGAARAGAADHPRRLRLRFAGELADDRFGDVVVAAPVGGALGQAELVEMAGAPRGMPGGAFVDLPGVADEIGRASCRERVCTDVYNSV